MELSFTSNLSLSTDAAWRLATRLGGINHELPRFLRLHCPADCRDIEGVLRRIEQGSPVFTATLLLFGVLPITWWKPEFVEYEVGRFVERSSMPLIAEWRHERQILDTPEGCAVSDRVGFTPRIPGTERAIAAFIGFIFRHRHRRLASV